jgi:hypothetical protein
LLSCKNLLEQQADSEEARSEQNSRWSLERNAVRRVGIYSRGLGGTGGFKTLFILLTFPPINCCLRLLSASISSLLALLVPSVSL